MTGPPLLCANCGVLDCIDLPSPNFDERMLPVSMIVLHYTGMPDCQGALDRLTSPEAKVSCHYLVDEDGKVYRLVDEAHRAWHSGKSRWRGITDVAIHAWVCASVCTLASHGIAVAREIT